MLEVLTLGQNNHILQKQKALEIPTGSGMWGGGITIVKFFFRKGIKLSTNFQEWFNSLYKIPKVDIGQNFVSLASAHVFFSL